MIGGQKNDKQEAQIKLLRSIAEDFLDAVNKLEENLKKLEGNGRPVQATGLIRLNNWVREIGHDARALITRIKKEPTSDNQDSIISEIEARIELGEERMEALKEKIQERMEEISSDLDSGMDRMEEQIKDIEDLTDPDD
jgi:hypothetical protein